MKQRNLKHLWIALFAAGLWLCSAQLNPIMLAQSQSQDPNAQQDQQKATTLLGKVVKARNGQFALLTDEQTGKGVYLDNQEKAKEFEGKNVKVTGVLDVAKGVFHVTAIEPA